MGLFAYWFLPHHSNNHRPKALHIDSLFVYVLMFAIFHIGLGKVNRAYPDILGYATDIHVTALLEATNQRRAAGNLPTLTLNEQLSAAAANKAVDMFAKGYWSHSSPDGKSPWDFIVSSGYRYSVAGENLAKNFSTSGSVVDAWMASASHRDNLLKESYRDVGFAVVNGVLNGEETTLVVQMFGAASQPVAVAPKPVEVPPVASQVQATTVPQGQVQPTLAPEPTAAPASRTVASAFASVTKRPLISIPTLSKEVSYAFVGILMSLLVVDAWLVSRRRIVRLAGHNMAHMFFFATTILASTLVQRGALL